jgi:two-component system response regulator YesN
MSRILIIDDEPTCATCIATCSDDQEYDIAEAENGQEALALAREEVFDLFITDIMMPKMTGLDFIGKLRGIDANALVVIITGFDDISYNRKAIECGAWRYLVKPVSRKELLGVARLGVQERSRLPYPEGLERHEHTRAPQAGTPALKRTPVLTRTREWMGRDRPGDSSPALCFRAL